VSFVRTGVEDRRSKGKSHFGHDRRILPKSDRRPPGVIIVRGERVLDDFGEQPTAGGFVIAISLPPILTGFALDKRTPPEHVRVESRQNPAARVSGDLQFTPGVENRDLIQPA
jgi:hypothetical protein